MHFAVSFLLTSLLFNVVIATPINISRRADTQITLSDTSSEEGGKKFDRGRFVTTMGKGTKSIDLPAEDYFSTTNRGVIYNSESETYTLMYITLEPGEETKPSIDLKKIAPKFRLAIMSNQLHEGVRIHLYTGKMFNVQAKWVVPDKKIYKVKGVSMMELEELPSPAHSSINDFKFPDSNPQPGPSRLPPAKEAQPVAESIKEITVGEVELNRMKNAVEQRATSTSVGTKLAVGLGKGIRKLPSVQSLRSMLE